MGDCQGQASMNSAEMLLLAQITHIEHTFQDIPHYFCDRLLLK
jgi:hypothetical protein